MEKSWLTHLMSMEIAEWGWWKVSVSIMSSSVAWSEHTCADEQMVIN